VIAVEGYPEAFTDFYYITHGKTPEIITPSKKFKSEVEDNRLRLKLFRPDESTLRDLKQRLVEVDDLVR